jgi:hypothetical protein
MGSMRRALASIALVVGASAARADDGGALFAGEGLYRPPIEWSTWIRAAYGRAHHDDDVLARSLAPPTPHTSSSHLLEVALGAEASLPVSPRGNMRVGGWFEVRGLSSSGLFAGAELVVTRIPRRLDMFFYEGHGILAVRAGASTDARTVSLAYGYLAPWWLEGPCKMRFYDIYTGVCEPRRERLARYMVGGRFVATVTSSTNESGEWSATFGFEFEPAAALRMLTIARDWY